MEQLKVSKNLCDLSKNLIVGPNIAQDVNSFLEFGVMNPNLDKFVKDLISISPTSISCERCFSVSSNIVTPIRARLAPDFVDCIIFLKYFYKI